MPNISWQREDRIQHIASGLETGQMTSAYAAALLRVLLSEIHVERFAELSRPGDIHKRDVKASPSFRDERVADKQAAFPYDKSPWLRSMDIEAVKAFISDHAKTKAELVMLAVERFSIPRAKLTKLSAYDLREEIRSALLHEESLRLISAEAERAGANRTS